MKKSISLTSLLVSSMSQFSFGEFHEPVRLKSADGFVQVESPGYACPCLADVDQDGKMELLVGQFRGGNIRVYEFGDLKNGVPSFDQGRWLEIGGKRAEVPGVW